MNASSVHRSVIGTTLAILTVACAGGSGSQTLPGSREPAGSTAKTRKIAHVVIIVQENRSPDNLFRGLPHADTNPPTGLNSRGQAVPFTPLPLEVAFDLDHRHEGFEYEWDNGKLDGWNLESPAPCKRFVCPPAEVRPYGYVTQAQVEPYFAMAEQYVFGDRMFQSNRGPSFAAHQYIISGTALAAPSYVPYVIEDNPADQVMKPTGGCDSPPDSLVPLLDPVSGNLEQSVYPCFDHETLMDLLDAQQISWRYYQPQTPPAPGFWTLDAIAHIVHGRDLAYISAPSTNVLSDIAAGTLPAVSWVIPNASESDHPEGGNKGPSWVASIVNAVGSSTYWNSTAVIVVWDDWGGWYDHVPPPSRNAYELGFRVPLIVVSPYAKTAYVSHVQYEFGSILKFVETQFGLPSLGYTDAVANDLTDCFDFSQRPRPFTPIPSRYSRSYFMHQPPDTRPIDDE